jgi:hypothetical protein
VQTHRQAGRGDFNLTEMTMTVTVKMFGIGNVEILDRKIIENLISDLDWYEVFKIAWSNHVFCSRSGECQVDLQNGKLTGGMYSTGETDRAVDSVNVTLLRLDQNEELLQFGKCGCPNEGTDRCNCTLLLDQDGDPYDLEGDIFTDGIPPEHVPIQLDMWYSELSHLKKGE